MLASVIVPTRDRSPLLGKALTSVAIQIAETGINCELITVEEASELRLEPNHRMAGIAPI
jgi:hypothetical protein